MAVQALLQAELRPVRRKPSRLWLTCDSAKEERVFADCFFDPGKCRLLWKNFGSEDTEKTVLDICSGLGIEGYFPFPYSV